MRRAAFVVVSLLGFLLLLTPQAVAQDKVVVVPLFGDEATGNASVGDVLIGKTFSNSSSTGLTGTRPSAPVGKTGLTTSDATGDDGDLRMGVQWPTPRFRDNGDGSVTDDLTGLIWLKNANCFGKKTRTEALASCNSLADGQCGLSDGSSSGDWRLPNIRELHSLIDFSRYSPALPSGHPFTGVQHSSADPYQSSTLSASPDLLWYVHMASGSVYDTYKTTTSYVWPVRGGN